jgi:hypothetical protein
MTDLVGQSQLRNLGRHPRIIVDEGDDARVQASLGGVVNAVNVFGIALVSLTYSTRSTYICEGNECGFFFFFF